ncbi:TIGR03032 family protein [Singulisphaera sp. Ch08]|uniref:TIGR03032 family protein n=1 Tax=Singulisphaera sp. Ch08 TaxID=3120278 RepID=A0AAU7CMS7_9BACT
MNPQSPNSAVLEPVRILGSPGLTDWLRDQRLSLAFTTYQSGKLFLVGRKPDNSLAVFERTFNRAMGLWSDGQTIWLSSAYQLWRFENGLAPGQVDEGFDRSYVPRAGYTTGDLDIHDVARNVAGQVVFVNTRFSCLATLSEQHSFTSLWKPWFIDRLAPDDRCHLNGLALVDGQPRYVTASACTNYPEGWRDQQTDGGVVIDVLRERILVDGLSMPHSPRWYGGKLWLLDSGNGTLGWVDPARPEFTPIAVCPGYARGLAFVDHYAVIGLSRPRRGGIFGGLNLDDRLSREGMSPRCGLIVVDLDSGEIVHGLDIHGPIDELYDVVALPEVVRPMAWGFKNDEISYTVATDGLSSVPWRANSCR